jgi:hypothetical protein
VKIIDIKVVLSTLCLTLLYLLRNFPPLGNFADFLYITLISLGDNYIESEAATEVSDLIYTGKRY